tara:strand:+ start:428 stop:1687 length:1260 start_codon:yes stop_codon:yes gene_type:complete
MKFDPRSGTDKPGIAIMIGVKPSKKDDKKKYGAAAGAQPHNVMKESPLPHLNTKNMQAADRRALAPKSLNRGGHLSGPPMNSLDWQLTEGYGGADKRNRDYDMEMAEQGDPDFDWPRRHQIYRDEDERDVYGDTSPGSRNFTEEELRDNDVSNLAYQQDQERQQIMDEGIPNPRAALDNRNRKLTGEPMDIAFQLLKYARVQRRGSLPEQIDMSMRGIGPARMKNFGQEINELVDNYDIDEMMNRNASMEAAESEAQDAHNLWLASGKDSKLSRGQMPPEQYNIWRERMHGMMPQKPAPGKEFENRRSWDYHSGRGERTPLSRDVQGQEKLSDEEAFYSDLDWPKPGARVVTGEPMDIAFQLLKDSAKARDGSPFAFPERDDPNVQPLPPNIDPSWTPEAIARINAQNDKVRRALRGDQ